MEFRPAQGVYVREHADGTSPTLRAELANLQTTLRRSRKD